MSFKAIEFTIYAQIGLALVVSSYGILFLIVREVLTFQQLYYDQMPVLYQEILSYGSGLWSWFLKQIMYIHSDAVKMIASPNFILAVALYFFFQEFIVSSLILYVLKTKSLVFVKITVIIQFFLRITKACHQLEKRSLIG